MIDICLGKNVKFLSQSTGPILDTGGPNIYTTDINFLNTFSKKNISNQQISLTIATAFINIFSD